MAESADGLVKRGAVDLGSVLSCFAYRTDVNVLPNPRTRVVLSTPASPFINANYVLGVRENKRYIATQGPTPDTLVDFWWAHNNDLCASLTIDSIAAARISLTLSVYFSVLFSLIGSRFLSLSVLFFELLGLSFFFLGPTCISLFSLFSFFPSVPPYFFVLLLLFWASSSPTGLFLFIFPFLII